MPEPSRLCDRDPSGRIFAGFVHSPIFKLVCHFGSTDKTRDRFRRGVALKNKRDALASELSELVTRTKSGFRAIYGPDSTQYEQAGGTRKSERAKPTRKPKATAVK